MLEPKSTCGSVKVCSVVMVEMTVVKRITGRSSGSVTDQNWRTGPAPSSAAASYTSPGMACMPAR